MAANPTSRPASSTFRPFEGRSILHRQLTSQGPQIGVGYIIYSVSMAGVRTGKLGIRIHLEVCSYRFDSGRLSAREFIIGAIQCFKAEEVRASSTCGGFKGIHTDYRIGYAASISNMLGSRGSCWLQDALGILFAHTGFATTRKQASIHSPALLASQTGSYIQLRSNVRDAYTGLVQWPRSTATRVSR